MRDHRSTPGKETQGNPTGGPQEVRRSRSTSGGEGRLVDHREILTEGLKERSFDLTILDGQGEMIGRDLSGLTGQVEASGSRPTQGRRLETKVRSGGKSMKDTGLRLRMDDSRPETHTQGLTLTQGQIPAKLRSVNGNVHLANLKEDQIATVHEIIHKSIQILTTTLVRPLTRLAKANQANLGNAKFTSHLMQTNNPTGQTKAVLLISTPPTRGGEIMGGLTGLLTHRSPLSQLLPPMIRTAKITQPQRARSLKGPLSTRTLKVRHHLNTAS